MNKESVEIEIDSVADLANDKKEKAQFETPLHNLRNSTIAPTVGAAGKKSIVQNVNAGNSEKSIQEMSDCLLYTSPSPRDATLSRMPSSA